MQRPGGDEGGIAHRQRNMDLFLASSAWAKKLAGAKVSSARALARRIGTTGHRA
jgi:hypothetical protein